MRMDLLLKIVCKTRLASFFKWQGENDNKKGWKIYRNYHPEKSRDTTRIIFIVFAPAHDLNNWTFLCWDESIWPEHQARTVMSSQWIRHCSTSWCSSNWQMLWASLVLEHMMNKAPSDSKTPKGRIKCDTQHETESTLLAVYLRFGASKLMTNRHYRLLRTRHWSRGQTKLICWQLREKHKIKWIRLWTRSCCQSKRGECHF